MKINRRILLGSALASGLLPAWSARAADSLLPVKTPGLDHLDVMVPDVEKTTRFYMEVLNTTLHAQPFQGGLRYFVLLGKMNEKREVGYLAVGDARGRGSYIGHFCTSVFDWRRDGEAIFAAMKKEFAALGMGEMPTGRGIGGIFSDPDGIEIQFLPAPDTLVTVAEPSQLVPWNKGLVTPHGVDHVLLRVSNIEKALRYYSVIYGKYQWDAEKRFATFEFPASKTRLILEQKNYEYGKPIHIAHLGIKVDAFDKATVSAALTKLGATVLPSPEESKVLRFRDPDNNTVELVPV